MLSSLLRLPQRLFESQQEWDELQKLSDLITKEMELQEESDQIDKPSLEERVEKSHALIVERAKADCARHLERCGAKPAGNPAPRTGECRVIRPAAVVADRVLAEMAAQGPTPLLEEEESTPELNDESGLDQAGDACIDHPAGDGDLLGASTEQRANHEDRRALASDLRETHGITPEPAPTRNWSYRRKAKGECGQRLAFNIDNVLREIRNPVFEDERGWQEPEFPYELANSVLKEIRADSSVDPPSEVAPLVGADEEVATVVFEEEAGAASTLTTEPSQLNESAWGLLCDGIEDFSPSDLQELKSALDANSELNAIALVASIGRAKAVLGGISPWTAPDAPLEIGAGDLVVLLRSALRGIR